MQWGNRPLKTGEPIVIKEPYYYYSGPPVNGKKQWEAKDGQKYRYCNFQNSVAVIQNSVSYIFILSFYRDIFRMKML